MTERVLITCAPPNPNGDLHVGHLSGPFLGADLLRRFLGARGVPVTYVSYTDDHSCYVPRRGRELGLDARQTAFRYTRRIEQTLSQAGMLADYYEHPHREPVHDRLVQEHFGELWRAGVLVERDLPTPYCPSCQTYLYEAYLRGRCRFCGVACDGTYCEECGLPQDPEGVVDGRCVTCGTAPEIRTTKRITVPLARFADQLGKLYVDSQWRDRVLEFCNALLDRGLPDTPISRIADYGIQVPLPGWEGHILDTWFCGIFGYLAATAAYGEALGQPELWKDIWQDPETTLVQFIGFDCSFSHAVLWPALLIALGGYVLPRHIISNEFYNLDGAKFSTSRGHAIWGADLLAEAPPDAIRLHLCLTNPENEQTNFRRAEFDRTVNDVLVGRLEEWAGTLVTALAAECGGTVPATDRADWPAAARELAEQLPATVAQALDPASFSPRRAAAILVDAVIRAEASLREAGQANRPATLAAHAELLGVFAAVAAPIMPGWARHAWRQLNLPEQGEYLPWPEAGSAVVPAGQRVAPVYRRLFQDR
jgi:methionyl-tRNA synthetase